VALASAALQATLGTDQEVDPAELTCWALARNSTLRFSAASL